ncbi:hypothetical protein D9M71_34120 [compost metagenome]
MASFMEERFPSGIDYGSGFETEFATKVVKTAGGNEYRALVHPYPMASIDVDVTRTSDYVIAAIYDMFMRAGGEFAGARVRLYMDRSTNNYRGVPTAFDQPLPLVNPTVPGIYQLTRWYGNPADPECIRRRLRKPVAGTVKVGLNGIEYPTAQWSVSNTTGIVTLAANKTGTITGIAKGSSTVITVVNSMVVGESVLITGVAGMTQINGLRALITARTAGSITVAINSALFSNYTSGGVVNTAPQTGEAVTAGCEFDIPMRFEGGLSGAFTSYGVLTVSSLTLVEILNPD